MQKYFDAPGSSAWHTRRATCFNAGDAAAMLGCSPNKTRTQLLDELHSGIAREFSEFVQEHVIDPGHLVEDLCRPIAEDIFGEELQVLAGSLPMDGLSRPLGASLDGITFMEDSNWECKTLNEELRAAMPHAGRDSHHANDGTALPKDKRVQMEQQMLVSGAKRTLFSAGQLNAKGEIEEERHAWYYPDPVLRAEIVAGWRQLDADLAAYVPTEAQVEAVGRTPETLPALRIEVTGMVTASNLAQYREHALAVFAGINRDLKTDQDFANADKTVKWCAEVESRLAAAKQHALSQTESIDVLFKTIDDITAEARSTRLELDKLVKARKEARRGEIVAGGVKALADHVAALNARLGKPYMPTIPADFGGAIKGLRTFDSMQNAVDTALATAKIAASATADRIQANLATLRQHAANLHQLFPDTAQIVLKAQDDLTSLVKTRVAEHRAAEAKKEEEQRERIRKEETERVEREQSERNRMAMSEIQGIQQQVAIAQIGRAGVRKGGTVACIRETLAETEAWTIDEERFGALTAMAQQTKDAAVAEIRALLAAAEQPVQTAVPAPTTPPAAAAPTATAPTVIPMTPRAAQRTTPPPATAPELKLGLIGERLGFALTAAFLAQLGFEPAARERGAVLYHESNFPHICAALVAHVQSIQAKQAA